MTPEEELLENLREPINAGLIEVIPDADPWFRALERRFPFVGNKIAWSQVDGSYGIHLDMPESEDFYRKSLQFAEETWKREGIQPETPIVVLNDGLVDCALRMSIDTFSHYHFTILAMPQHNYLVAEDCHWCMPVTSEGYIDFGYATNC